MLEYVYNGKFEVKLEISQDAFVNKFLKVTELRDELINDVFPNKKHIWMGKIAFNSFEVIDNNSSFNWIWFRHNYKFIGTINEENGKARIVGSLKGHLFELIFYVFYTSFCFIAAIYFAILHLSIGATQGILGFMTILGLAMCCQLIGALNGSKRLFIEKMEAMNHSDELSNN